MELSAYLNSRANYSDKVAKAGKVLPTELLILWSIDCAESVLHIFEQQFPEDTRVRDCINVLKAGARGHAADYAANAAAAHAAYAASAANAAAHAASAAYYAADYAANPASNAADYAAYCAAYYAANAAANAASNEKEQEELNLKLLLKQVEIFESPLYQALQEVI